MSFAYRPGTPVIEDLSLVAEPGSTVAIVGPTGAGKTTLVNLLMRFYEVDSGRILIDGVDITSLSRHGAAIANRHGAAGHLAFRRHDRGEHRLRTPGGQRRRGGGRPPRRPMSTGSCGRCRPATRPASAATAPTSAPARSSSSPSRAHFLPEPQLLILDEATSSVDTRTEALIAHATPRASSGSNEFHYRAPSFDDPGRRPHPRGGGRQDRRARQPRRTAGPAGRVLRDDPGLKALGRDQRSLGARSLQEFVEITKRTRSEPFLNHQEREKDRTMKFTNIATITKAATLAAVAGAMALGLASEARSSFGHHVRQPHGCRQVVAPPAVRRLRPDVGRRRGGRDDRQAAFGAWPSSNWPRRRPARSTLARFT